MIRNTTAGGIEVCQMKKLEARPLFPSSFYLSDENRFVPFEYNDEPIERPDPATMTELATELQKKRLRMTLGICFTSPLQEKRLEIVLQNRQGTVSIPVQHTANLDGSVITEWAFIATHDGTRVRALKACKEDAAGLHGPPSK